MKPLLPIEELCHLIEVSSHKRFRMAKAQELQELARNSFGFAMAGDVFSTMIRIYAKHLHFYYNINWLMHLTTS